MNRYDQKLSYKYPLKLLMIAFIAVSMILLIWLFQKNNQANYTVSKPIELPAQNPVSISDTDTQTTRDTEVPSLSGAKQTGINTTQEEIVNNFELMELEESDDSFREGLKKVSENLIDWFNYKDVIKKMVIIINDLSQNQIIYKHRKFLRMPQKFLVKGDAQGLYISEQGYKRFDLLTKSITAINVQKGLDLYLAYRPLLTQVFDEFGYPTEYQLEDIFMKAASSVIEAPIIKEKVYLVRHSVRYKFASKKLEALDDVKKLMLRMGPENTAKIQDKLRELVESLVSREGLITPES